MSSETRKRIRACVERALYASKSYTYCFRIAFNCGKNEIVNFGDGPGAGSRDEREPAPIGRVGHRSAFCLFNRSWNDPSRITDITESSILRPLLHVRARTLLSQDAAPSTQTSDHPAGAFISDDRAN